MALSIDRYGRACAASGEIGVLSVRAPHEAVAAASRAEVLACERQLGAWLASCWTLRARASAVSRSRCSSTLVCTVVYFAFARRDSS